MPAHLDTTCAAAAPAAFRRFGTVSKKGFVAPGGAKEGDIEGNQNLLLTKIWLDSGRKSRGHHILFEFCKSFNTCGEGSCTILLLLFFFFRLAGKCI